MAEIKTQTYKNAFEIPSPSGKKVILPGYKSLKISLSVLPLWEAFNKYKDYDKVAIVTRHSIREDWDPNRDSSTLLLVDRGIEAAKKVGALLKEHAGNIDFKYFSTGVQRCTDTAKYIAEGLGKKPITVDESQWAIISGTYFDFTAFDAKTLVTESLTKHTETAKNWQTEFVKKIKSYTDKYTWWVSHDSFVGPLIYNLTGFNPTEYANANGYGDDPWPWPSPLTGIIVAIKGDNVYVDCVAAFEKAFTSTSDWDYKYTEDIKRMGSPSFGHIVATTYSHPHAINKHSVKDETYIFDVGGTNNNPLACNSSYSGCLGYCVGCQVCVASCYSSCYGSCVSCNSCQNCDSCQTNCQLKGYGYVGNVENGRTVPKVIKTSECAVCVQCNSCNSRYNTWKATKCSPCNSCYNSNYTLKKSELAPGCNIPFVVTCDGCTASNTSYGCYDCVNKCYDGCTTAATSTRYSSLYKCDNYCMQCNTSLHGCDACYQKVYTQGGK